MTACFLWYIGNILLCFPEYRTLSYFIHIKWTGFYEFISIFVYLFVLKKTMCYIFFFFNAELCCFVSIKIQIVS